MQNKIIKKITDELTEMEQIILESMLQGDNIIKTSQNCGVSVAHAQSYRKTIYDIVSQHTDLTNKKTKQKDLIAFFEKMQPKENIADDSADALNYAANVHEFVKNNDKIEERLEEAENPQNLKTPLEEICELQEKLTPFKDPYFKDLKMESIAELAKKSFKITDENHALNDEISELHSTMADLEEILEHSQKCLKTKDLAIESKQSMIEEIDKSLKETQCENNNLKARIRELEIALNHKNTIGSFCVYNPNHGQPNKIYNDFHIAKEDAKKVAENSKGNDTVYVLKLITKIVPRCDFDIYDLEKEKTNETYFKKRYIDNGIQEL